MRKGQYSEKNNSLAGRRGREGGREGWVDKDKGKKMGS